MKEKPCVPVGSLRRHFLQQLSRPPKLLQAPLASRVQRGHMSPCLTSQMWQILGWASLKFEGTFAMAFTQLHRFVDNVGLRTCISAKSSAADVLGRAYADSWRHQ